ncbi:Paxillin [Schistosoma japonicum]|nr:Paxillin [Schistosoma japonicum]
MDELDYLLNDLHQTNQKILQKNNATNSYSDCHNSLTHITKADHLTESDCSIIQGAKYGKIEDGQNCNASNQTQLNRVHELNEMLASLDNFDYVHLDQAPQTFSDYNQNQRGQLHENPAYRINTSDYELNTTLKSNEKTILAAKEAERQLDDLLHSLRQFKVNNHQSDSGAELPSSMSNSFLENSLSDIQKNSHTPSHKSSTSSNYKTDTSNTNMNNLGVNSITADVKNNGVNYQHHNNKTQRTTDNVNSTTRLQRHNAKRAVTPKYNPTGNVPSAEQGPNQLLNSMLNDLSSELSQHGAKTNPHGLCYACKKPINGTLITAIGKEWHPEHFTCASCRVGLVRQDFYERDDQAYCTQCHLQMFSPRCGYCGEAVIEKCVLALARAWHPEHFFCYECHSTFNGSLTVHEQNGKLYCSDCYFTRFGTPCSGCQQPITDAYITALNMPWHKDCFTCHDCNKILTGSNFHEFDGYPYCDSHYYSRRGLLCVSCSLPITGRCVNALGKRYHPEHFLCAYCLHPLQTGTFKEHSVKPYCHQCFTQLFG